MPHYLVQTAYTPDSWATMVMNPQNRAEAVRPAVEGLGGKIVGAWLSFGEYDLVAVCEFPDNVTAAAFSISVAGAGSVKAFKTTPLMTMDEAVAALSKAGSSSYSPPK
jgi:uncharacterized protein with GYD domain